MDLPEWGFFDLRKKDESPIVSRFRFAKQELYPINVDLIPRNRLGEIRLTTSHHSAPGTFDELRNRIVEAREGDRVLNDPIVFGTRFGSSEIMNKKYDDLHDLRDFFIGLTSRLPKQFVPGLLREGWFEFTYLAPGYEYLKNNRNLFKPLPASMKDQICFFASTGSEFSVTQDQAASVAVSSPGESFLKESLRRRIGYLSDLDGFPRKPTKNDFVALGQRMGMIFPPSVSKAVLLEYLIHNAPDYREVVTFSGETRTLEQKSDQDIFGSLQIYFPYKNRRELLQKARRWNNQEDIIFRPLTKQILETASNQTTICSFDEISELWDQNLLLIGIGHKDNYYLSSEEDLICAFETRKKDGVFTHPMDGSILPMHLTTQIDDLLRCYLPSSHTRTLMKLMSQIYAMNVDFTEEERQMYSEYIGVFTPEERKQIDDYMMGVFYTGMYMRRWKGPGHPYPILQNATFGEDPDTIVNQKLFELKDKYDGFSSKVKTFLSKIRCVRLDSRKTFLVEQNYTFQTLLESVSQGHVCIRASSTDFIATAARHFVVFNGTPISGVEDLREIQMIS